MSRFCVSNSTEVRSRRERLAVELSISSDARLAERITRVLSDYTKAELAEFSL